MITQIVRVSTVMQEINKVTIFILHKIIGYVQHNLYVLNNIFATTLLCINCTPFYVNSCNKRKIKYFFRLYYFTGKVIIYAGWFNSVLYVKYNIII